jgi:hypothetical protein
MEEIVYEVIEDITKNEVSHNAVNFIINHDEGCINVASLKELEQLFVEDEFFFYAESVRRALKSIKLINE